MMQIKSFAKINLALEVTGREANGYHTLNNVMCTLGDYYDEISIDPSNDFAVNVYGKYTFEGENIVQKIANKFKEKFGGNINFKFAIKKNIKTGAGLGGGSSNAGEVLNFLLKQNGIELTQREYSDFTISVGADVPFFYNHSPKMCYHFGEEVAPLNFIFPTSLYAIVVLPAFAINTKKAFQGFEYFDFKAQFFFTNFNEILQSENSLTKYAIKIEPEIKNIIFELKKLPKMIKADMSGSGSACFALFDSFENLKKAEKMLPSSFNYIISSILVL